MFRKIYSTTLLTIAILMVGAVASFSQTTAPVRGRVELTGADGKVTPVGGALIEVFRVDVKSKFPTDTTDKKGGFSFAGLPVGAVFVLSVSGPGISPSIMPNVKAGREDLVFSVSAGDGKRWTEAEVRSAITQGASNNQKQEETADEKKKREEYEKQVADIKAKNEKTQKAIDVVNASLKEGGAAYDAKNYDLAVVKFDEGFQIDPEFPGSAPVMLNNKSLALLGRATETYNKSVKADEATKTAAKESAKNDFAEIVNASNKALEILKTAPAADPATQKGYEANKFLALRNRKSAYRLMAQTGVDRTRGKEALVAFDEYIAAETDAVKKMQAQVDLANTLQDSDEFELALNAFQKVLEVEPNNVDALAGAGLNMVNVGYLNLDADPAKGKLQLQEAANFLQKFVDVAPAGHKLLESVKTSIEELKKTQNVAPVKGGKTTTTTKKKN